VASWRPFSNSASREDVAHPSEKGTGCAHSPESCGESNSRGSTLKAPASFLIVPKCGREILPLSIPETVVGLTFASSANRPCVHIRSSQFTEEAVELVAEEGFDPEFGARPLRGTIQRG
jgi:hypothetical protein